MKILAILNIILGSLGVLGAIVVLLIFGGIGFAGLMADSAANDGVAAAGVLGVIGLAITIFILLLSLPSIIAGVGLLKFRPWARILTIVLSALHLLNIPFGTALGVYGFWVLLSPETEALFRTQAIYPTAVPPQTTYMPPRA